MFLSRAAPDFRVIPDTNDTPLFEGHRVLARVVVRPLLLVPCWLFCVVVSLLAGLGCRAPAEGPIVVYLDGAGWYTSWGGVERGLNSAGYKGAFDTFTWSAFLGPAHDHLFTARSSGPARRLARRLADYRQQSPDRSLFLMGLSAGTAVVLSALEQLPPGILVDHVVLFSPTVSSIRDLSPAMAHVRGRLYATCSPNDSIINGMVVTADGERGPPAGRGGFRLPPNADASTRAAYARIVNIRWRPSYAAYGWSGSHTSVTDHESVGAIIAPRILSAAPFPLDRPVMPDVEGAMAEVEEGS